jgi:hypothetical protein
MAGVSWGGAGGALDRGRKTGKTQTAAEGRSQRPANRWFFKVFTAGKEGFHGNLLGNHERFPPPAQAVASQHGGRPGATGRPGTEKPKTGSSSIDRGTRAGVAAERENQRQRIRKNMDSNEKIARKDPQRTPEDGGVLTPLSPILTFSSSIPQRRPRPEMTAGGCRGRSLQRCSSGGMASFPPASRGSMSPGRGRVGALRASWRAGRWGFGRFVWFFFRLAWLGSVRQG